MKNLLLVICLGLIACACKNTPCSNIQPEINAASIGISNALGCANTAVVEADIYAYVQSKGWCKNSTVTGPIALIVCPLVVDATMDFAATKLPATWGCTLNPEKALLITACNAIPF